MRQAQRWGVNRGRGAMLAAGTLVFGAACLGGSSGPGALAAAPPAAPSPTRVDAALPPHLTPAPGLTGDPERGRRLLVTAGCAGCHTVQGVPGASGVTGPNLTNVVIRPTLAGESISMSPATMTQWLLDPQSLKPGATMPKVGLTPAEAQDLTAFLFSQPYNVGR